MLCRLRAKVREQESSCVWSGRPIRDVGAGVSPVQEREAKSGGHGFSHASTENCFERARLLAAPQLIFFLNCRSERTSVREESEVNRRASLGRTGESGCPHVIIVRKHERSPQWHYLS